MYSEPCEWHRSAYILVIGGRIIDNSDYFQNTLDLFKVDGKQISYFSELILDCALNNNSIWIFGNGGSASTAEHFETDLSYVRHKIKNLKIKAFALTGNSALVSAIANDVGFEKIFSHQLLRKASKGDLCIAISASGNSLNLVHAIDVAKQIGLISIGLLGFNGGTLANKVDFPLIVESEIGEYGLVEDAHLAICHAISENLLTKIKKMDTN